MIGVASSDERDERAPEPDAEEDDDRFVAAVARRRQLPLQLAHLRGRLRRRAADLLERRR